MRSLLRTKQRGQFAGVPRAANLSLRLGRSNWNISMSFVGSSKGQCDSRYGSPGGVQPTTVWRACETVARTLSS
jgi:hypothetical protein